MRRGSREFKAESFELEGRLLLANAHASIPGPVGVEFEGTSISPPTPVASISPSTPAISISPSTLATSTSQSTPTTSILSSTLPTQVVGQQDGVATVILTRNDNRGRLRVQVTTDPSSPAVGVNVGAVDQTVTFANGQIYAGVTVPILSGAPNPGEVDVNLAISSVDGSPQITTTGPLELRILASDATVPPQIVSTKGEPHGIVLTFSKQMNPIEASNVNNYAVNWNTTHSKYDDIGAFALIMPGGWSGNTTSSSGSVRLKSARYDPATNSVTLIPQRPLNYSGATGITVTQGHPAKTLGRPGQQTNPGQGLTDLEGNPINSQFTHGKFSVMVFKGFNSTHAVTTDSAGLAETSTTVDTPIVKPASSSRSSTISSRRAVP
jgi:hypothetical protein